MRGEGFDEKRYLMWVWVEKLKSHRKISAEVTTFQISLNPSNRISPHTLFLAVSQLNIIFWLVFDLIQLWRRWLPSKMVFNSPEVLRARRLPPITVSNQPEPKTPQHHHQAQTNLITSTSPSTSQTNPSPHIYPPPWSHHPPPIVSPSYFKNDPASSTNYTQGWLQSSSSDHVKLYTKGKRPHQSSGFWSRLGGGLNTIDQHPKHENALIIFITSLAILVRCWAIWRPSSVVWEVFLSHCMVLKTKDWWFRKRNWWFLTFRWFRFDEVHFGGFASKYIKSAFFMDVHPPLAKLLITLVAFLSGYKGNFNFKDIGRSFSFTLSSSTASLYSSHASEREREKVGNWWLVRWSLYSDYTTGNVPYVQMRLLPALLGAFTVPLSYLTMRMLTLRPISCLLGSLLIIFENGMIVQSRFILLDSPLLFFTTLTIFFHTGFCNEDAKRGFTRRWWAWLLLTGVSLGAVASSKWVGFFTIATVGLVTIQQLWELLADLRVPMPLVARSFIARAITLILVPVLFYMFMFQIHFLVLSGSGEGDAFMSSEFQHTLRGHWMPDTFAEVLIGSNVTIRHTNTQGGYLHSHPQAYPTGSRQQQITLYPHSDTNNIWTVLGRLADDNDIQHRRPREYYHRHKTPVNHTTFIRLEHAETTKRLHTHDVRAPVTEVDYQNEVSGYGFPGFPGTSSHSLGDDQSMRLKVISGY